MLFQVQSYLGLQTPPFMNNSICKQNFCSLTVVKIANIDLSAKFWSFEKYKNSNISIYKSSFWIYVLFNVDLMSNKAFSCIIQGVSMFFGSYLGLWTPQLMNNLQEPIVFINRGLTVYRKHPLVHAIDRHCPFMSSHFLERRPDRLERQWDNKMASLADDLGQKDNFRHFIGPQLIMYILQ